MRQYKSSTKNNSSKKKYTINTKSNVIFEDTKVFPFRGSDFTNKIKFISDPNEPLFRQIIKEK